MIAAFDVHYPGDGGAAAAAVLFSDYTDPEPAGAYARLIPGAAEYVPGAFYRRELPSILELLGQIEAAPKEIVVDGYVMLGSRAGLGQHLYKILDGKVSVVGVAKSRFRGASGVEVFRGSSRRPLYVTAAGTDLREAAERIRAMHGAYRIPTLLKQVDLLAREKAREAVCAARHTDLP